MNKKVSYFFAPNIFESLPYGATSKATIMTLNAHIVVKGHCVAKHYLMPDFLGKNISENELSEWKKFWDGVVVTAPCL